MIESGRMRYRAAWWALLVVAIVVILFELFFRYRYVRAGDQLWRIDRITERACLVGVGDAICSESTPAARPRASRRRALRNPYYFESPTPEPNPP